MREVVWISLSLVLIGCGPMGSDPAGEHDTGDPTDTDAPDDTDDTDDTDDPAESLPDIYAEIDPDHCKDGALYDPEWNVGLNHYIGDFRLDGDEVSGTETLYVFFNETATANLGISTCEVVWHASGLRVDPGACAACDYGLQLNLEADAGLSDCPEGLWIDFASQTVRYDVKLRPDGELTVHFAGSGNEFGYGYAGGDRLLYLSDPGCKIY